MIEHAIRRAVIFDADGRKEREIVEHYLTCVACAMERERQYKVGVCGQLVGEVFAPNCSEGAPQ